MCRLPDAWGDRRWRGTLREERHLQRNRLCTYQSRYQRPGRRSRLPFLHKQEQKNAEPLKLRTSYSVSCCTTERPQGGAAAPSSRAMPSAGRQKPASLGLVMAIYGNSSTSLVKTAARPVTATPRAVLQPPVTARGHSLIRNKDNRPHVPDQRLLCG